ncbi:MAG TPA: hypothetical protein VLF62_01830 [Candidatus Saccharimonadales bacterium]|nr:hypothetical protein [Candidatus Saccharimonadales bacterium]
MAVLAEAVALPFAQPGFWPPLEVVSNVMPAEVAPPGVEGDVSARWRAADSIAGLRLARHAAAQEVDAILEERMELLREGEFDAVPNEVDPLTTAARVLEAEGECGADSPEHHAARTSLKVDARRLLGEAYRKNTWEYFPELEQPYDEATESYTFMGRPLLEMVRDGVTPAAREEEGSNRTAEYVEEATYKAIRDLGHISVGNIAVLRPGRAAPEGADADQAAPPAIQPRTATISECPDWAIAAYEKKSKGGYGHYVPQIKKLMIRGVRFGADVRYQEQLAVSGEYITHDVVVEGLREMNLVGEHDTPTKAEVLNIQGINLENKGAWDVLKLLDSIASKRSGQRIFMGEVIPEDQPRDYAAAEQEALARQDKLEAQSEELTDFLIALERGGTDHDVAQGIVEKHVHKMVFNGVKGNPEAAAAAFDEKTAERVEKATRLRATGQEAAARNVEAQAEKEAPPVSFCGAGSCNLESADDSDEANEMRDKLKTEDDEELLRDTERSCPKCSKKSLWYSYSSKVVKTGCSSCGSTNTKVTK